MTFIPYIILPFNHYSNWIFLLSAASQRTVDHLGWSRRGQAARGRDRAAEVRAGSAEREAGSHVQTGTPFRDTLMVQCFHQYTSHEMLTVGKWRVLAQPCIPSLSFSVRSGRLRNSWRPPGGSWPDRRRPTRNYRGTWKRWHSPSCWRTINHNVCLSQRHKEFSYSQKYVTVCYGNKPICLLGSSDCYCYGASPVAMATVPSVISQCVGSQWGQEVVEWVNLTTFSTSNCFSSLAAPSSRLVSLWLVQLHKWVLLRAVNNY